QEPLIALSAIQEDRIHFAKILMEILYTLVFENINLWDNGASKLPLKSKFAKQQTIAACSCLLTSCYTFYLTFYFKVYFYFARLMLRSIADSKKCLNLWFFMPFLFSLSGPFLYFFRDRLVFHKLVFQ
ncbi:hypothetical protein ACJX0J_005644, partial [Zea mays]